jgi:hypothetical protein
VATSLNKGTIVAAYDAKGAIRPGWPIALVDWPNCSLWSAVDGSIRVLCPGTRAFAFDIAGRPLPGWPVDIPDGTEGSLYSGSWCQSDDPSDASRCPVDGYLYVLHEGKNGVRLNRISVDGTLRAGPTMPYPQYDAQAGPYWVLGADGTAFWIVRYVDPARDTMLITAYELEGARSGWPIRVPYGISHPVAGPDGRVYLIQETFAEGIAQDKSRILAFQPNGHPLPDWDGIVPVVATQSDVGPYIPGPPLVAADGSAWLVTETLGGGTYGGTTAYAVDAAGHVRAGWPYHRAVGRTTPGYSSPCDIDAYLLPARPVLGPDEVLYLLQQAASAMTGGQITAIASDGKVRDGWPVVLSRPGAAFWSVVARPDGMAYALAVEPEPNPRPPVERCAVPPASATILAIGPDGRVRYRVTVVEP